MGHGILPLTQRGSPHGRRLFGSGHIGIDLNEGKDCPQDMCPPRVHRLSQRYWDAELCVTEKTCSECPLPLGPSK